MLATAICLQPPDYGSDLTAGRIVHATQSRPLLGDRIGHLTVSCDRNHQLIAGSCMLDINDPMSHQITLFYHGLSGENIDERETSNTWRCAWNNPTMRNVTATVTAVCVAPPIERG